MVQSPWRSGYSKFLGFGKQFKQLDISVSQRMISFVNYDIVKLQPERVIIVSLSQQGHDACHLHPFPQVLFPRTLNKPMGNAKFGQYG